MADGNGKFSSEDGVLYDKAKTELLLYPMAKLDKSLVIPDSVTSIASYAFKGARYPGERHGGRTYQQLEAARLRTARP